MRNTFFTNAGTITSNEGSEGLEGVYFDNCDFDGMGTLDVHVYFISGTTIPATTYSKNVTIQSHTQQPEYTLTYGVYEIGGHLVFEIIDPHPSTFAVSAISDPNVTIEGDFVIQNTTESTALVAFNMGSGAWTVGGNLQFEAIALEQSLAENNGTLVLTGTNKIFNPGASTNYNPEQMYVAFNCLRNVTIHGEYTIPSNTPICLDNTNSTLQIDGTVTLDSTASIALHKGVLSNFTSGTIQGKGSLIFKGASNISTQGTIASPVVLYADSLIIPARTWGNSVQIVADSVLEPQAFVFGPGSHTFSSHLSIVSKNTGTAEVHIDAAQNNPSISISGDFTTHINENARTPHLLLGQSDWTFGGGLLDTRVVKIHQSPHATFTIANASPMHLATNATDTLPQLVFNGADTLVLSTNSLVASSYTHNTGILQFNGNNVQSIGSITIQSPAGFSGLEGQTIYAQQNIAFLGTPQDSLHLTAPQPWYIHSAGSITAQYAILQNSHCTNSTGVAVLSRDASNNVNWQFSQASRYIWTGAGSTDNWSDGENWSLLSVPGLLDTVVFTNEYNTNSIIDGDFTISALYSVGGYAGTLDLASATLTIQGTADFRHFTNPVQTGAGTLHFSSADTIWLGADQSFYNLMTSNHPVIVPQSSPVLVYNDFINHDSLTLQQAQLYFLPSSQFTNAGSITYSEWGVVSFESTNILSIGHIDATVRFRNGSIVVPASTFAGPVEVYNTLADSTYIVFGPGTHIFQNDLTIKTPTDFMGGLWVDFSNNNSVDRPLQLQVWGDFTVESSNNPPPVYIHLGGSSWEFHKNIALAPAKQLLHDGAVFTAVANTSQTITGKLGFLYPAIVKQNGGTLVLNGQESSFYSITLDASQMILTASTRTFKQIGLF
jgi:hypothetical protein